MKVSWEWLLIGAAAGAVGAIMYGRRKTIPNAYALGQANPTVPFTQLTAAQQQQIGGPPLPSPPPISTQMASITANATPGTTV